MASPRTGKFSQDVTVSWSDGTLFTGFGQIEIILPTYGADDDAEYCTIRNYGSVPTRVPSQITVPILEGKYNNTLALIYNTDLVPPNSQHKLKLVDSTKRVVTSFSDPFTVSSDPFTPPTLTPTVPSVGA